MGVREALANAVVRFLTREIHNYQRRIPNNLERLKRNVRPGDVVLVEGKTRVAQVIKYLTQSSWSHSAFYVGDRLVSDSHPLASRYRELYGDDARHMIVEADLESGVAAVPIVKYADHNLRLCRPFSIFSEDLERVGEEIISRIGDDYDSSHLVDLGRYLTPFSLVPERWRGKAFSGGASSSRSVICSSLIARAFLDVRYPILPALSGSEEVERRSKIFPYGRRFRGVPPRLVLPRDFDLSPYFRVVKFNQIEEGPFDYRTLQWEHADETEPAEIEKTLDEIEDLPKLV